MNNPLKLLTSSLVTKLPSGVDEYFYMREWYSDGDEFATGKFLNNGSVVETRLSLRERKIVLAIAKEASESLKAGKVNRVLIVFRKDGSNSTLAEFIDTLDLDREKENRTAIGDELYEKLEQERKDFKEPDEQVATSYDSLTIGQLLGYIQDNLLDSLPERWESILIQTRIDRDGEHQSISTDFYYQSSDGIKKEFEPENPIASMDALLNIKDKMVAEGNDWNESTITIHKNGDVDIQTKPV